MSPAGFKPVVPTIKRLQIYALVRTAIGIGRFKYYCILMIEASGSSETLQQLYRTTRRSILVLYCISDGRTVTEEINNLLAIKQRRLSGLDTACVGNYFKNVLFKE